MKVTLLLPALNEEAAMRVILPRIQKDWCDQFLLVDGRSEDGTVEYAKSKGWEVVIQKKKGLRHAFLESWHLIRGDAVITFSPDGNCIPELIPPLINKMKEGYDMVVASRYYQGIKSEDDDLITAFGNWMFTTLINVLHGGSYSDAMGMFRIYRTNLFYELDLDKEGGYAPEKLFFTEIGCEPLLSIRAARAKAKISEIGAPEPARIGGKRKLQVFCWGGAYLTQVLREVFWKPAKSASSPAKG